MFGQDDTQQQAAQAWQQPVDQSQQAAEPAVQSTAEAPVAQPFQPAPEPTANPVQNDWQQPVPTATSDWATPVNDAVQVTAPITAQTDASNGSGDLMEIKQKALTELSPLVSHLDQSPEEKFKTTMMMIQASDNQDLITDAYAAAQAITDNKVKAQALLDIVNEINYFTQHQS
jgi:hypothetical protein